MNAYERKCMTAPKLIRSTLDAITGVIVNDDSQFVKHSAHKRRAAPGEPTGVYIKAEVAT